LSEPFCIITKSNEVVPGSVLKAYESKAASQQITDSFTDGQYQGMQLAQPPYNLEQLAYLPELNTYHDNCIKAKAHDTAGLGWELKTAENLKGQQAATTQYDDLYNLLAGQWPVLTTVLTRVMTDYESIGNGYLECTRLVPEGPVQSMFYIPGYTIRVHRSKDKYCQQRGLKKRWFKRFGYANDVDKNDGHEVALGQMDEGKRASEVIQFASFSSRSDFYGIPDGITALGAIVGARAAHEYNIKFFSNFGVPAYAVYISGDYELGVKDDHGEYELIKYVKDYFNDLPRQPHSTMVLAVPSESGGQVEVKIVPLAVEIKDASFRMYRKDNRDEVIAAHRVPPYCVGIAETGSLGGSTAEESMNRYIESVLNPRQEMIEQHFDNMILPTLRITDWRFQLKEIDNRREEHDITVAEMMFRNGSMKPNELIRFFGKRFGMEPDEGNPALEAYYVNGQMLGDPNSQEPPIMKALKGLHDRLVTVATKEASDA
jgi:PBSX family phage portal protein